MWYREKECITCKVFKLRNFEEALKVCEFLLGYIFAKFKYLEKQMMNSYCTVTSF